MEGNQTWFAREDYVEESWRILDPVLANLPAPYAYDPGTWGPAEASKLIQAPAAGRIRNSAVNRKRPGYQAGPLYVLREPTTAAIRGNTSQPCGETASTNPAEEHCPSEFPRKNEARHSIRWCRRRSGSLTCHRDRCPQTSPGRANKSAVRTSASGWWMPAYCAQLGPPQPTASAPILNLLLSRSCMPRSLTATSTRSVSCPPICRPNEPPAMRIKAGALQPWPVRQVTTPWPY